jgi:hypothetical protein
MNELLRGLQVELIICPSCLAHHSLSHVPLPPGKSTNRRSRREVGRSEAMVFVESAGKACVLKYRRHRREVNEERLGSWQEASPVLTLAWTPCLEKSFKIGRY